MAGHSKKRQELSALHAVDAGADQKRFDEEWSELAACSEMDTPAGVLAARKALLKKSMELASERGGESIHNLRRVEMAMKVCGELGKLETSLKDSTEKEIDEILKDLKEMRDTVHRLTEDKARLEKELFEARTAQIKDVVRSDGE